MTELSTLDAILAGCDGLPVMDFAEGDILLAQGPGTGRMFVLVSGGLEIVKDETVIAELTEPGAIVGEMAALLGNPHSATVRASASGQVHRIDDAAAFLRQRPDMMFHVACILARRLTEATAYLADVKAQYADRADHLGMVDTVLDTLLQRQDHGRRAGARATDPRL